MSAVRAAARAFDAASRALAPRCLTPWSALGALRAIEPERIAMATSALPAEAEAWLRSAGVDDLSVRDTHTERWLVGPESSFETLAERGEPGSVLLEAARNARQPAPVPELMGVLNVTPDSFSDGGRFTDPDAARTRAHELVASGAHWIDVGGESTRPGAPGVDTATELERVTPLLERLADDGLIGRVSIDTKKAAVAAAALDLGCGMVNDVSAGTSDPAMLDLVAERQPWYVAMHMQGRPETMQRDPRYDDPVRDVLEFFRERGAALLERGFDVARLVFDPGVGFGKRDEHNLALLGRLGELRSLGRPLLVGVSRKSFIGRLTGEDDPRERAHGTSAAHALVVEGGAGILRVHDPRSARQALDVVRGFAARDSSEVDA